jgi:hypothetical protein
MAAEYTVIDRPASRKEAGVNARQAQLSKLPGRPLKETAARDD